MIVELINRWGIWVDSSIIPHIKSEKMQEVVAGFLKYNMFVLIGWLINRGILYAVVAYLNLDISVVAIEAVSAFLGAVYKDLLPSYDTNGDGKIDYNDLKSARKDKKLNK